MVLESWMRRELFCIEKVSRMLHSSTAMISHLKVRKYTLILRNLAKKTFIRLSSETAMIYDAIEVYLGFVL